MFGKSQSDKTKKTLQKGQLNGMKEIEAISKYRQSIMKKKKKIELLYEQSISNQIYIFPRAKRQSTDSSETDSQSLQRNHQGINYDLKSQNKKNKNYQTSSHLIIRCSSVTSTQPEKQDSRRKDIIESQRPKKQANQLKNEANLSNYQSKSRKQKNQEKTATNSGKKLFYLPSNGTNKGHMKKPSETIIVSFRGKHGQKVKYNQKSELY